MMRRWTIVMSMLLAGLWAATATATPTQDEVFKSIHDSVDSTVDPRKMVPYLLIGVGIVIMAIAINHRVKNPTVKRSLHHPHKLLRQMRKNLRLRSVEMKQLKILADEQELSNPLTLLLCPSMLARAMRSADPRIDRQVVQHIVQRLREEAIIDARAAKRK